eukprot:37751_1
MSDNQKSHNFRELSENLSHTFLKNFNQNKRNSTLNPSKYLSQICFNSSDSFRDKLFNFDPIRFSFSDFGDELIAKEEINFTDINNNDNTNRDSEYRMTLEEETLITDNKRLAENLSHTFLKNFRQKKRNSILNPSPNPCVYDNRIWLNSNDSFRDRMSNFDPMRFSFSNFSDELTAKNENKNQNEYSTFHAEIEEEGELNINKKDNSDNKKEFELKKQWNDCYFISVNCKFCEQHFNDFEEYCIHLKNEFDN